jgi:hypothetical protein
LSKLHTHIEITLRLLKYFKLSHLMSLVQKLSKM